MVEVKGTPNHFKFGYTVDKVTGLCVCVFSLPSDKSDFNVGMFLGYMFF